MLREWLEVQQDITLIMEAEVVDGFDNNIATE